MIDIEKYYYDYMLIRQEPYIPTRLFKDAHATKSESVDDEGVVTVKRNREDEEMLIHILRYVFEYYLGWDPEYTRDHISDEVLKRLNLYTQIQMRVTFPPELSKPNSPYIGYILSRMYPDRYHYDRTTAVEEFYERYLAGGQKMKTFFDGSRESDERAKICLRHAFVMDGIVSVRDQYAILSGKDSDKWLRQKKLKNYCDEHYTSPIDFLRDSIVRTRESENAYLEALAEVLKKEEKRRTRKRKDRTENAIERKNRGKSDSK